MYAKYESTFLKFYVNRRLTLSRSDAIKLNEGQATETLVGEGAYSHEHIPSRPYRKCTSVGSRSSTRCGGGGGSYSHEHSP